MRTNKFRTGKLINKSGRVRIYEYPAFSPEKKSQDYEVIVMGKSDSTRKGLREKGKFGRFPATSDWGKYGFTFRTPEKAVQKFYELLKNPDYATED